MPQNHLFEITYELRRLAENNVDRARQLYFQFLDGVSKAIAVWPSTSSNVLTPGFQEARERAIRFAKENADAALRWQETLPRPKISENCSVSRPVTYNLR